MVGRIAGPYRRCHLIERVAGRTRAGHVHAERIADCTILAGAALCASGLAPCGASWAGTVVPDRQRRAAATPRGHRAERGHSPPTTITRTTQSHTVAIGGSSPVQVEGRRVSRAGPGLPSFGPTKSARACHSPAPRRRLSQTPRLTRPLARSPRHAVPATARACHSPAPRRRLNQTPRLTRPPARSPRHAVPATSLAGDSDAPGPPVPGGPVGPHRRLGRTSRRHGPPGAGRPRSSWDSDARDHGPPAPRHQVATHDFARAMSRHRPSAFGRDPDTRARFAPLKTPAPVTFSAAASQAARSTVASPSLPPVLSTVPAFFSPVSYVTR